MPNRLLILLAAMMVFVGSVGCAPQAETRTVSANVVEVMGGSAEEGYARAVEPRTFEFPLDHGPHPEYRTEWWYYTGNLDGEDDATYGYQLTFFRSALTPDLPERPSTLASNQVYMAHFAITDGAQGEHVSFERFSRGAGGLAGATGEPGFSVWLEDWSATAVEPGVMRLQASTESEAGPISLDLLLNETRPAVLNGKQGLHQKGPEAGNASYYYSLVGLETSGSLTVQGEEIPVTGQSWMDHEFGTSALSDDATGWDWFSIQLDNGAVLMLYQIRTASGANLGSVEGTLVWPDGQQEMLTGADFTIAERGQWTSPNTGIVYPSGWQIEVPAHAIDLRVDPLVDAQEMDVSFVYWEGAVEASGAMADQPVNGRGYVELTGYGQQDAGDYQR